MEQYVYMNYCPKCGSKLRPKNIDDAKRLACIENNCGFVHWNNPVPVVAALVQYGGEYVIARNVTWPKGIFSLITGYLEHNETPKQAVVREVSEELGLKSQIKRYIGNYSFYEKNQLILCYEVQASGNLEVNHELVELKQLSPKELSEYDFSPLYITEKIIKDWKNLNAESA